MAAERRSPDSTRRLSISLLPSGSAAASGSAVSSSRPPAIPDSRPAHRWCRNSWVLHPGSGMHAARMGSAV